MSDIHKKKVNALIHSLGLKYGLLDDKIKEIVESPYFFADGVIRDLPLKEIKTEDELDELKTNFYFKNLGKLHIPFPRVERRLKKRITNKEE